MLAPHAVDIHSWNLSNYYLTMFHICKTIWRHFSLRQVKLCIGQREYKQKFTTQGRKDWLTDQPSEWICTRSLNSYFAFLQKSRKNETALTKILASHCCANLNTLNTRIISRMLLWGDGKTRNRTKKSCNPSFHFPHSCAK